MKTAAFASRLKLCKSANFSRIFIKLSSLDWVINFGQGGVACGYSNSEYNTRAIFIPRALSSFNPNRENTYHFYHVKEC